MSTSSKLKGDPRLPAGLIKTLLEDIIPGAKSAAFTTHSLEDENSGDKS